MSYSEQKRPHEVEKKELLNLIKNQRLKIKKLKEKYNNDINILNFIVQNLPGSVYWKNQKGIYLGYNDYAKNLMRTLGFTSEVIGKTDYDIFPKEVADDFRKTDLFVLSGKKLITEEVTILPNLKKMVQLSSKIPLRDKAEKIVGILGISLDITDRKKAEYAKEEFIMNMSHDLRTPLAGIIGLSNIQAIEGTNDQDRKLGQWVHDAGEQLLELLNSVIEVTTAEHPLDRAEKEKVDLVKLAEELQALMQPTIQSKKLTFQLKIDPSLPIIISNKIKLKTIFLNILSNAIKFTKQGDVRLEINLLSIVSEHAKIEIRITDTGIGITKDNLDKIFDRFYRAHPSYEAKYKGYGIGLFLVKKAVELLGGEIKVDSKEGKGSCFTLEFIFSLAEENVDEIDCVTLQPSSLKSHSEVNKYSVLVVEDNTLVLHAVKNLLGNLGYDVTSVTDGKAALHALQTQSFVWALLDIGLPDLDGAEVARLYRQWEQENNKPHLPIFALTAHAENEAIEKFKKADIDYVFHKPFTEKHINTIQKFLKK